MATQVECCLCNADLIGGGDTLCDECINKAAAYDDLKDSMRTAMRVMRSTRDHSRLMADSTESALTHLQHAAVADTLDILLGQLFAVELAEDAAQKQAEAEFQRQADAAQLRKVEAA